MFWCVAGFGGVPVAVPLESGLQVRHLFRPAMPASSSFSRIQIPDKRPPLKLG